MKYEKLFFTLSHLFIFLYLVINTFQSKQNMQASFHQLYELSMKSKQEAMQHEILCERKEKGVLDRSENDVAVLLIERKEKEFVLSEKLLPKEAREGDWFTICANKRELKIKKNKKKTDKQYRHSKDLINKVRKRESSHYFSK